MLRKNAFAEESFYHLYNRGVDKRRVFTSASDYKRFLALLYLANSNESIRIDNLLKTHTIDDLFSFDRGEPTVAIGAFCLMPNHFHLLVTPLAANAIPKFMLKLQTGYSMYFNKKYERSGSLFQGPFKSQLVENDEYLRYLYTYIHLNSAKLKDSLWRERPPSKDLKRFVQHYPYSSYNAYARQEHIITNPKPFPDYFSNQKEVERHITDWLISKDYPC